MEDPIPTDIKQKMQKALQTLHADFQTVRTGKASPALVENISIKAYGGTAILKVNELATIHVADVHTLVLTPFDKSVLGEIERGIADANVGINPIIDGTIIRINLPPLSEERRREFVKLIHQKAEAGKVTIRQMRQDGMNDAKKLKADGTSEDEVERIEREVQRLTDKYIEEIDALAKQKEEELMKV